MKKTSAILFLCLPLVVFGQRVKYKDLVLQFPSMSIDLQKNAIKEFLAEEPDHPNANLRLAMIYERNYRTADPLTAFAYAMANAEQTKIRYLKSKMSVDDREVDRNNEYYAPIFRMYDAKGKPAVPFGIVSAKMTGGYDSAELFMQKMPSIYKSFTASVNAYDRAVKIFARISKEYASEEDLYLLYDKGLDEQCTKLKSSYDSCILSLNQYLALVAAYPLKGHQQKYVVKPIETYHLDGLITRLNFLTNTIDLWDYASWVDKIRKVVITDIEELRKRLQQANEGIDETLKKISVSTDAQLPMAVKLDKQVAFNLNNFDRQSTIQSLMDYKHFRELWDIENRSKVIDTAWSIHNAEVYSGLIYSNRKADTLLRELKTRLTPTKVDKHRAFVTKFYGGPAGLERYSGEEEKRIKDTFGEYTRELRNNIVNQAAAGDALVNKDNIIKSGKYQIPLAIASPTPELLDQGALFTRINRKNPDGSAYLAGSYKPDKKKNLINTYVARANPDGKAAWMKEISVAIDSAVVGDANTQPTIMALTQEGCAIIIRSVHTTRGDAANTLIYFNEKGEEKLRLRLKENAFPRFILYSEKANAFVITLKGTEEKQQFASQETVTTIGLNVLGEAIWKKEVPLTGTLTDLIGLVDGYMLAGNFIVMQDLSGKEVRTKAGSKECNPFMIKFGERGELLQSKPVLAPYSIYLHRVVKINDNSINMLGYAETLESGLDKAFTSSDKMIHIMTNRQTQVVCTTY